jgi:uncharacterized protein
MPVALIPRMSTALPPSDLASIFLGASAALMVGLAGSLHCLLMCGPLACATLPGTTSPQRRRAILAYQGARALSYTALGALLGALGGGVANALSVTTRPYLPWIMAAALVASALELGKRLRPLPGLRQLASAIARLGAKFSLAGRSAAIGAATPLLPCGLLYGVFAAALAAGSMGAGALILGAFALGGLPALLGAQAGSALFKGLGRRGAFVVQRAVPLVAAVALVVRAVLSPDECH